MFCENCGKQIEDSAKFCKYCGCATGDAADRAASVTNRNVMNVPDPQAANTTGASNSPEAGANGKRKKLIAVIFAVAAAAVLVVCGFFIYNNVFAGGSATKEEAVEKAIYASASGDLDEMIKAAMPGKYEDIVMNAAIFGTGMTEDKIMDFMENMAYEYGQDITAYFGGDFSIEDICLEEAYSLEYIIDDCEETFGIELGVDYISYEELYVSYTDENGEYYADENYTDMIVYSIDDEWYAFDNNIIYAIMEDMYY